MPAGQPRWAGVLESTPARPARSRFSVPAGIESPHSATGFFERSKLAILRRRPGKLEVKSMSGDIERLGDAALMRLALEEAQAAAEAGDVPVGAVAVLAGAVIARQHNRKEEWNDPTAHAEILLLREVANRLGRWRLPDVTIYCTMEPCPMCAGAMVQARIGRLVYAVDDPRAGAAGSVFNLLQSPRLNHRVEITRGVLAEEAKAQLDAFFATLRRRGQDEGQSDTEALAAGAEAAGAGE